MMLTSSYDLGAIFLVVCCRVQRTFEYKFGAAKKDLVQLNVYKNSEALSRKLSTNPPSVPEMGGGEKVADEPVLEPLSPQI